ncbi:hypothetical protein [Pseudomonas prosekii]|uniref:Uncharacterized protein n=1 Tax=Pseudomonas prosekii TaxID=1148509 RepID=A0A2U2D202_9PSED|nr:hypothetical protein [Pseudomonas prosekii]PWE40205.1 hypothetical protein C9I49_24450 [Pseudomonas prosekii]
MKIFPILTQMREQCTTVTNHLVGGIELTTSQAGTILHASGAHFLSFIDVASKGLARRVAKQWRKSQRYYRGRCRAAEKI